MRGVRPDGPHARPRRARERAGLEHARSANDVAARQSVASVLAINAGAGIGPAFRFGRVQVAGYGILRVRVENDDPNSEVDERRHHLAHDRAARRAHGGRSAADRVVHRAHRRRVRVQHSRHEHAGEQRHERARRQRSAGTPVSASWIDQFRFDGSLQHGFVTGGPNFIGGTALGLPRDRDA